MIKKESEYNIELHYEYLSDIGLVSPYRLQIEYAKEINLKMSFVNDPQMVNVAVSRAINQLILIADTDAFYKNGNELGDLIKYIEYHDIKNIEEGRVISVFDLLYKEYSHKLLVRKEALSRVKKNIKYDSENKMISSVRTHSVKL
ncbi:hypothetical protein [Vallitalea guaymasensis]|uniref:DNA2/NAM7 helicase-like C-terminal domain-containing protein n=1 Tax=Vallitalea guaymasensis TaxID=1185412 RepID=A0A8J8M865_9FIRM|nr:hypothetical protein [Vallitalea guaymasensis]QUH28146.1 hypothetical protein HYG85_04145 [Vallitalea guaymasensis]